MVGTVSAARRSGGRRALAKSEAAFAVGLALGGASVFGALGLVGATLHPGRTAVALAVAVAVTALAIDAAGRRVRPQIRFQVPESWRRTMPLPRALFLYGLLLGTGLTTYVPAATAWALLPLALVLGSVTGPLAIGLSFAAGRALPVLILAWHGEETVLAERPQGLRALRALAALSLVLGLVALVAGEARAATTVATPAGDPSATGTELAWQRPGLGGFLSRNGQVAQLPGTHPAIGGALVAWYVGSSVTVASRDTLTSVVQLELPGVQTLAVSDTWLVERVERFDTGTQILVQPLADTTKSTVVASAKRPGELGRPSLSGDIVLFHRATAKGSWITAYNIATGARRKLRSSDDAQLLNPSLLGDKLLYVRQSRCSQELRVGPVAGGKERVLYRLPPLAGQDRGHERGHTSQGEHPPCPHRPHPTAKILWTTALASGSAYVTVLRPVRGGGTVPTLLQVARPRR
jgi:cytochrome c biogenesis protein CcdA